MTFYSVSLVVGNALLSQLPSKRGSLSVFDVASGLRVTGQRFGADFITPAVSPTGHDTFIENKLDQGGSHDNRSTICTPGGLGDMKGQGCHA